MAFDRAGISAVFVTRIRRTHLGSIAGCCAVVLCACNPDRIATTDLRSPPANASRVVVIPNAASQDNFIRGIHYFTGSWGPQDPHWGDPHLSPSDKPSQFPWAAIQNWNVSNGPDREPRLGWYDELQQGVSNAQILAMVDAAYDYVIYQHGWSHTKWRATGNGLFRGHTIANHMASPHASRLKFSALFHDGNSTLDATLTQPSGASWNYWSGWTANEVSQSFAALYTLWFRDYATNANFHRYNDRPVVFFFDPGGLRVPGLAVQGAPSAAGLISLLRSIAAQYGFSGATTPYVVGQNVNDAHVDSLPGWGFDAHSGYGYYTGQSLTSAEVPTGTHFSEAYQLYAGTQPAYPGKWHEMLLKSSSSFQFWVPNGPGLDRRPWGEPYDWTATAPQFKALVIASMDTASANVFKTGRNLITCCWNEWGEGPAVEPYVMHTGYAYRGSQLAAILFS